MNPNNIPESPTTSSPVNSGDSAMPLLTNPLPLPGKPSSSITSAGNSSAVPSIPPPAVVLPEGPDPLQVNDDNVTDLDEESWILKTKQVIARHQEDPFTLTEELYKLRAQFMQDVHGKELKQKDEGR